MLSKQIYDDYELNIVDNESTDESVVIAQKYSCCKILTLKRNEFTYGKALNYGIENADGEYIIILSAHFVPNSIYFIQEGILPFVSDDQIAAVRLPLSSKVSYLRRSVFPKGLTNPEQDDFISDGPLASGCIMKKDVWKRIPFDETMIAAEEKDWACKVLKDKYKIYTASTASYMCIKKRTQKESLHKNFKEIVAVEYKFNVTTGFCRTNWKQMVKEIPLEVLKT